MLCQELQADGEPTAYVRGRESQEQDWNRDGVASPVSPEESCDPPESREVPAWGCVEPALLLSWLCDFKQTAYPLRASVILPGSEGNRTSVGC